jgi:membrane protease YdiL (CAAX protease family)
MNGKSSAGYVWVFAVLAAPFYLNDFASIFVAEWGEWLAIDYIAVKLFPLAVIAWLITSRRMTLADFGLVSQPAAAFVLTLVLAAAVATLIDQNAYSLLAGLPGYSALGGMPEIRNSAWNRFDLSVGLLFVGFVEELVFRAYAHTVIRRYTENPAAIIAISAIAFGLIHWSLGLVSVLVTAVIGAVFMAFYLRTRSVPALALAHFAVNFIDYAGVIPKAVFKFV